MNQLKENTGKEKKIKRYYAKRVWTTKDGREKKFYRERPLGFVGNQTASMGYDVDWKTEQLNALGHKIGIKLKKTMSDSELERWLYD